jgi:hypothetical protein
MHFQRRCKDNLTKDTNVQYLNLLEDKSNLPNVRTSTRTNPTSVPKNSANFTKERRKARSGVSIHKVFTEGKPHTSKINESPRILFFHSIMNKESNTRTWKNTAPPRNAA